MIDAYKHIFIDLDDTIWDFYKNSETSLKIIFEKERLKNHFESFDSFYKTYTDYNKLLWHQYGERKITKQYLSFERFRYPLSTVGIHDEELVSRMHIEYLSILSTQKELKPYAKELLDYFKSQNKTMTIISNGFSKVQKVKIEAINIGHYFDYIVFSEDAGALKPDKKIFEYALKLNNAQPSETLMIGDNYDADVIGAINSGIDALFLNNTHKKYPKKENVTEIACLSEILKDVAK